MFSCVFYLLIYIISIGMVHRTSHSEVFCQIGVLRPATLFKKDSVTSVLLRILRNF